MNVSWYTCVNPWLSFSGLLFTPCSYERIPGILSMEHGVNNSPEKLNQGFTHVFQVTFTNAAARDAYLPHPAHKAFGTLLGSLGILDAVFVVDYAPTP